MIDYVSRCVTTLNLFRDRIIDLQVALRILQPDFTNLVPMLCMARDIEGCKPTVRVYRRGSDQTFQVTVIGGSVTAIID